MVLGDFSKHEKEIPVFESKNKLLIMAEKCSSRYMLYGGVLSTTLAALIPISLIGGLQSYIPRSIANDYLPNNFIVIMFFLIIALKVVDKSKIAGVITFWYLLSHLTMFDLEISHIVLNLIVVLAAVMVGKGTWDIYKYNMAKDGESKLGYISFSAFTFVIIGVILIYTSLPDYMAWNSALNDPIKNVERRWIPKYLPRSAYWIYDDHSVSPCYSRGSFRIPNKDKAKLVRMLEAKSNVKELRGLRGEIDGYYFTEEIEGFTILIENDSNRAHYRLNC